MVRRHDIEDLNQKLRQSQQMETLEKQRLDIALDNMTQGLLLFDASERLVVCNQRYIEIYGLSPDVVKPGSSFRDLVAHRKLTGSFRGDVEEYCSSTLRDLARGAVTQAVVETGDGRRRTIGPGDHFGEMALLDHEGRSATVTAASDMVLGAVPEWGFKPFLQDHPEVTYRLLETLSRRLRDAEKAQG